MDHERGPGLLALVPCSVGRSDREPQTPVDVARHPPVHVREEEGIRIGEWSANRLQESGATVDPNRRRNRATAVQHPVAEPRDLAVETARGIGEEMRRPSISAQVGRWRFGDLLLGSGNDSGDSLSSSASKKCWPSFGGPISKRFQMRPKGSRTEPNRFRLVGLKLV